MTFNNEEEGAWSSVDMQSNQSQSDHFIDFSKSINSVGGLTFLPKSRVKVSTEKRSFCQSMTGLSGVKKVQFGAIVLACTVVLIIQVIGCIQKYLAKNTSTADKYVHVASVDFPDLTICPSNPYLLGKLLGHGHPGKEDFTEGSQWSSKNDASKTPESFYNEIVHSLEDILIDITVHLEQDWAEDNFDEHSVKIMPNMSVCGSNKHFNVKPIIFHGDCFQFDLPLCVKELGPLEMTLNFKTGVQIFIHHGGQFLSPNSRKSVSVEVGKTVNIAVNHEIIKLVDGDSTGHCVNTYGIYSDFDGCMYSKMEEIMLSKVGCTVPWLLDKSKICKDLDKAKMAYKLYHQNRRNQEGLCPNSCLFTNMYFGPPVYIPNDPDQLQVAKAQLFFPRDIKVTEEYFRYNVFSMLAEIGGYVGLLVGASLVNVGNVNNFLLDLCFGRSKSKKKKDEPKPSPKRSNRISSISYPNFKDTGDSFRGQIASPAPVTYYSPTPRSTKRT